MQPWDVQESERRTREDGLTYVDTPPSLSVSLRSTQLPRGNLVVFVLSAGSIVGPSALGIIFAIIQGAACEGEDCVSPGSGPLALAISAWLMWTVLAIGAATVEVFRRGFSVTLGIAYGVGVGLLSI